MSRKTHAHLAETLDLVAAGTFQQRDVRLLFADLRQFLKNPLLRDIADYIAHPEGRTKGISNIEIDLNFHKICRIANKALPLPLTPVDDRLMELWQTGIDRTSSSLAKTLFTAKAVTTRARPITAAPTASATRATAAAASSAA